MSKNLAASVRAKLLNIAKSEHSDFNNVLIRFALERFLYRLSQSDYADQFLLKGALLFTLWYEIPHRGTRDMDLLGFGSSDLKSLEGTFQQIASIDIDDGIKFDPSSIRVDEIRKEAGYSGVRILISAELAGAKCKTQVDIGFGDAVTLSAEEATYPTLLADLPAPKIKVYPVYTVVAEKIHAICLLGMTNSRLKDYFDLYVLIDRENIDINTMAEAISATFKRRGTTLPKSTFIGLSEEFIEDASRQKLWRAFLNKNGIEPIPLEDVVNSISGFIEPVLKAAYE